MHAWRVFLLKIFIWDQHHLFPLGMISRREAQRMFIGPCHTSACITRPLSLLLRSSP